jgi:MFS family permease
MRALSNSILKKRDFLLLLFTRMFVVMALQAQAVIVGWQIYTATQSTLMLGLTGLVEAVPAIIGAFFAGYIVDKNRPHFVYYLCVSALLLNTGALVLIAGGIIPTTPHIFIMGLFVGVFFSGLARCFFMPSSFTLFSQIVPRSETTAAAAWMNSGFQFATIASPASAGLLYGYFGARVAWMLPLGLLLAALLCLVNFSPRYRAYRGDQTLASLREPAMKSIRSGWAFVWSNPVLLSVMALDMFAVLLGGAVAMLPAFAHDVLQTGAEGLGFLRAAPAIGAVVIAVTLALYPLREIRGRTLLLVVAAFGLSIIGFGLSTNFAVAAFFLACSGAVDSVSMIIRATIMQWLTPDDMRGRVSSVNSMFITSSNEIGTFYSGVSAKIWGLVPSIVLGGVSTLIVVLVTLRAAPQLWSMRLRADEKKE